MPMGRFIWVLTLVLCAFVQSVQATDYSFVERASEEMLTDPEKELGVIGPEVHISTSQVTINYIGASGTIEGIMKDIGAILGIYWAIVDKYPEVGDLLITVENLDEKPIATFYCLKSWAAEADIDNTSQLERLALKVINTAKTLE